MSNLLSVSAAQLEHAVPDGTPQQSARGVQTTGGEVPQTRCGGPKACRLSVSAMCCLAASTGMFAGLVESLFWGLHSLSTGPFDRWGSVILWLSPPVQMATFIGWAISLVLLARLHRARVDVAQATAWLMFLAALNFLLLWESLHILASLLLAWGIAARTRGLVDHRQRLVLSLSRAALAPLALACGLAFMSVEWLPRIREHVAARQLPPANATAPNILLIVLDTVRADALCLLDEKGMETVSAHTPHLARLAREGFHFRQATSTAPWTLPAHASLFTGREPRELGVGWERGLDRRFPTLAEALRARGYRTAGFVSNTFFVSEKSGLQRGFLHYEDQQPCMARALHATALLRAAFSLWPPHRHPDYLKTVGRKSADQTIRDYLVWLDAQDSKAAQRRPHFAFINLFDAHDPFLPPDQKFAPRHHTPTDRFLIERWWGWNKSRLAPRFRSLAHQSYLDCVSYLDDRLGRLCEELQARGEWNNTIVLVTSDHGEHFGDHQLYGHGNSLYQTVLHVPLLVRWPGHIPAGGHSETYVSLQDIPATLLELVDGPNDSGPARSAADAKPAAGQMPTLPGRSLAPLWDPSREDGPRRIISCVSGPWGIAPSHGCSPVFRGPMRSVTLDGWKYIAIGDDEEAVYHLPSDPQEQHDLSQVPSAQPMLERLRHML